MLVPKACHHCGFTQERRLRVVKAHSTEGPLNKQAIKTTFLSPKVTIYRAAHWFNSLSSRVVSRLTPKLERPLWSLHMSAECHFYALQTSQALGCLLPLISFRNSHRCWESYVRTVYHRTPCENGPSQKYTVRRRSLQTRFFAGLSQMLLYWGIKSCSCFLRQSFI